MHIFINSQTGERKTLDQIIAEIIQKKCRECFLNKTKDAVDAEFTELKKDETLGNEI